MVLELETSRSASQVELGGLTVVWCSWVMCVVQQIEELQIAHALAIEQMAEFKEEIEGSVERMTEKQLKTILQVRVPL